MTFSGTFSVKDAEKVFRDVAQGVVQKVFREVFGGRFKLILVVRIIHSMRLRRRFRASFVFRVGRFHLLGPPRVQTRKTGMHGLGGIEKCGSGRQLAAKYIFIFILVVRVCSAAGCRSSFVGWLQYPWWVRIEAVD